MAIKKIDDSLLFQFHGYTYNNKLYNDLVCLADDLGIEMKGGLK